MRRSVGSVAACARIAAVSTSGNPAVGEREHLAIVVDQHPGWLPGLQRLGALQAGTPGTHLSTIAFFAQPERGGTCLAKTL